MVKKILKICLKVLGAILLVDLVAVVIFCIYNGIQYSKEEKLLDRYPGQLVEVNGHNMNVVVEGEGAHTLVFLAPSQDTSPAFTFKPLYSELSDEYRTVVVEKFGYGRSDIVDTPRDYQTMVDECRAALTAAGVEAPYILCPYSKSGIDTMLWVRQYPDEVEAVIGIDMAFPAHLEKMDIDAEKLKQTTAYMDMARTTGLIRAFAPNSAFSPEHSAEEITLERAMVCRKYGNKNVNYDEFVTLPDACALADSQPLPDKPMLLFLTNGVSEMDAQTWQDIAHSYADGLTQVTYTVFDCSHYDLIDKESAQMVQEMETFIEGSV